jgi:phosphoribosylaminoimidazole carboxylase PurE protein
MKAAVEILRQFDVPHEVAIVSAHRTPERMFSYAKGAVSRGLKCIIAGAGGAAHLPGMVAALTPLPVIGVPVRFLFFIGLYWSFSWFTRAPRLCMGVDLRLTLIVVLLSLV